MPDAPTLQKIYNTEYSQGHFEAKSPGRVVDCLRYLRPGTFVDYGCGNGELLAQAMRLGWQALGTEYNAAVADRTSKHTGATVVTDPHDRWLKPVADVLHLGDVIEHLTDLEHQMPKILSLVKPGGLVVAQGPLEANAHIWLFALKAARRMRPRRIEMPPMHVILASSYGQQALFVRFGLVSKTYEVTETAWPAPDRIVATDLLKPRSLVLFSLRRISQVVTGLHGGSWGNRYFYVGRVPEESCS